MHAEKFSGKKVLCVWVFLISLSLSPPLSIYIYIYRERYAKRFLVWIQIKSFSLSHSNQVLFSA